VLVNTWFLEPEGAPGEEYLAFLRYLNRLNGGWLELNTSIPTIMPGIINVLGVPVSGPLVAF
jgi:hypothetical protein